ncbi:MAG: 16S rRNA (cytosine(967)-C(5))-methyltransferase RsmB, partial [Chlorobiota bacterium]
MEIEEHRVKDLYTGVRGTAVKILDRIERTDSYLEKLLDHELKNSDLSGQDKALLYELVHGVVRWMGRLDWILAGFYKGQFSKAIPVLKNALRVALYQIMFLDKIPDYAIVNEAVDFVKKLQGQKPADITNAVLRNIIRSKNGLRYPDPAENLVSYLAAYYSHPTWLAKRWVARYGREAVETLMAANNERPTLTLRINGLKVDRQEFEGLLQSVNLRYTPGIYNDHFYRLQILTNIQNWQYFAEGYFAIQDESTGMPCLLLDVKPGMRVLDMCAAPGGKSAYIADLMSNTGEVVALDKFESRVKMMQANLDRLGVSIVKFVATDALEYEDELFDRVLV